MKFPYKNYRWFFTKSGKLIVGGKSAKQNDDLIRELKKSPEDKIVMHTSEPGSPFSIIVAPIKKVTKSDLEETAIFTGCFSRAWREQKTKATVDIFNLSGMSKPSSLKTGTWQVKEKLSCKTVELKLALTKQKGKLRAVPEQTAKKILLKLAPGKIDKKDMLAKFQIEIAEQLNQDELLSALPAGGVSIKR